MLKEVKERRRRIASAREEVSQMSQNQYRHQSILQGRNAIYDNPNHSFLRPSIPDNGLIPVDSEPAFGEPILNPEEVEMHNSELEEIATNKVMGFREYVKMLVIVTSYLIDTRT